MRYIISDHALQLVLMCSGLQCIGSSFDSLLCTYHPFSYTDVSRSHLVYDHVQQFVMILRNRVLQTTGHTATTRQSLQKSVQQRSHKLPSCDIPNLKIILFYKQQSFPIPCPTMFHLLFWIYRLFLAYLPQCVYSSATLLVVFTKIRYVGFRVFCAPESTAHCTGWQLSLIWHTAINWHPERQLTFWYQSSTMTRMSMHKTR